MLLRRTPALASLLFGLLAMEGCSASGDTHAECQSGAECASGICNADGTCDGGGGSGGAGATTGSGGATSTGGGSATSTSSSTSSATGSSTSTGAGTGGSNVCSPNHDGQITHAEIPLEPGLHANYEAASCPATTLDCTIPVDMTGKMVNGVRTWDLTASLQGDHSELVETQSMTGKWFAASFPDADYAAKLSDSADLLGVFKINDQGLYLMGVVSPMSGSTQTLLTYSPAVTVLQFPIKANATWTTSSTVSGMNSGVSGAYFEKYDSTVDAVGSLKTPFSTFPVMRVRTDLTRTAGAVVTKRTFSFVSECFGSVANVVSNYEETTTDFTTAAEVTRLSP